MVGVQNQMMQKEEIKVNAIDDVFGFGSLNDYERQMAETNLLKMRKEASVNYCKFCNELITDLDETSGNVAMI